MGCNCKEEIAAMRTEFEKFKEKVDKHIDTHWEYCPHTER